LRSLADKLAEGKKTQKGGQGGMGEGQKNSPMVCESTRKSEGKVPRDRKKKRSGLQSKKFVRREAEKGHESLKGGGSKKLAKGERWGPVQPLADREKSETR